MIFVESVDQHDICWIDILSITNYLDLSCNFQAKKIKNPGLVFG